MRKLLIYLIILFSFSSIALAQTGKISGVVTDAATGEPLIGANVLIEGTTMGAATDFEGYYVILNVPPGNYSLRCTMIGFQAKTVTGVDVNINQTSEINFDMQDEAFQTEEVVVVATNPIVEQDVSSSKVNLEMEEIENLPVASTDRILTLQPGVQLGSDGIVVRGGGADQTVFMVNGISLRDDRSNVSYTGVSLTAIEEIQVQTGGFNAEYGNIRSGLVNIVTKSGAKDKYFVSFMGRYRPAGKKHFGEYAHHPDAYWIRPFIDPQTAWVGTAEGWADDPHLQNQYPEFDGFNNISEETLQDDDPNNDLTPLAAQQIYLYQHRKNTSIDDPDYNLDFSFGGPFPIVSKELGNLRFVYSYRKEVEQYLIPLYTKGLDDYSHQVKLTSDLSNSMKLMINGLMGRKDGTTRSSTGSAALYNSPEQISSNLSRFSQFKTAENRIFTDDYWAPSSVDFYNIGAKFTHVLSSSTFYEITLQMMRSEYDTKPGDFRDTTSILSIGGIMLDEAPFGFWPQPTNGVNNFRMSVGFSNARDTSVVTSYTAKFDLSSQVNKYNNIKTGFEFTMSEQKIRTGSIDEYLPSGRYKSMWDKTPVRGAVYLQNKFEYEGMVANVGLRLDYSHAGGEWYVYDTYTDAFSSANSLGIDTLLDQEPTDHVFNLSPRIGIAFPISVDSKLYFNYGHFRQLPDPMDLYLLRRYLDNNQVVRIADPNAPLPKTVAYELGYEQNILDMFLLRIAGYYKDVTDQPTLVYYTNRNNTVSYGKSEPNSYEDIRGFEIQLTKNRGEWVRGFINYTYMVSTWGRFGFRDYNENPTVQADFERVNVNNPTYGPAQNKPIPRPYARANVDFFLPTDFGPDVAGVHLLGDWRLNILANWSSGQYFTWTGGGSSIPGVENNMQWTDYWNVDLRFSKSFHIGDLKLEFFADITNALNIKRMSGPYYAFIDTKDYDAYLQSLQLPEEAFEDFPGGVPNFSNVGESGVYVYGDDTPGDFREGEYIPWDENASESQKEEWRKNKSYIDMPNQEYLTFLNPRDIYWGLRFSWELF